MLKVNDITAGYQGSPAIYHITHCFWEGRITAVIGPNGSGKSTLLKAVTGLCEVYEGKIYLGDMEVGKKKRREFFQKVSYLPQSHAAGAISVSRMVLHGRFPHLTYPRRYREEDYFCCQRAMEQIGILPLQDKRVEELSGGQRQKVYIAMALAGGMEVCLFDEPATYLDVRYQLEVLEIMEQLRREGKTVIVVLHDLNHAMQVADEVLLLEQGKKIAAGTPEEIIKSGMIDKVFQVHTKILKDETGKSHMIMERKQQE